MVSETGDRMKVVIYYAVWATLCAVVAGIAIALIHTWFFSYNPGRSWLVHTLVSDILTAMLLAAGQGAVALVTGSLLARLGREPSRPHGERRAARGARAPRAAGGSARADDAAAPHRARRTRRCSAPPHATYLLLPTPST